MLTADVIDRRYKVIRVITLSDERTKKKKNLLINTLLHRDSDCLSRLGIIANCRLAFRRSVRLKESNDRDDDE